MSIETEIPGPTRWDKVYPALGTEPVPVAPCLDPEYYELERKRVFGRTWLYFGRAEALAKPGDFRVKDFAVCNAQVLVTRARDGQLRAFHNICPHRGRALTDDEAGNCRAFSCNFHGWTFDPDGSLKSVPAESQFFDFERRDHGLFPVAIDVWEGFIFVSFAKPPMKSLEEYLGEFGRGLLGYPFGSMTETFRYSGTYKANWKLTLDAFQEFYHVKTVHRHSLGETVHSPENEYSNSLAIKLHPLHRLFSGYGNPAYQPTPVEMAAFKHGKSMSEQLAAGDKSTAELLPPGVNPTRSGQWSFDLNVVFPNFTINILAGMYFTHEFWPLSHDTTYHEMNMYFRPHTDASELFSHMQTANGLRDTVLEDGSNLEQLQTALSKGTLSHFTLQDEEILVRHSHRVIDEFVRADDPYEATRALIEGDRS